MGFSLRPALALALSIVPYSAFAEDLNDPLVALDRVINQIESSSSIPGDCECDWNSDGQGEPISPFTLNECGSQCGGTCSVFKALRPGEDGPPIKDRIFRSVPCKTR